MYLHQYRPGKIKKDLNTILMPAAPRKWIRSAECDPIYTIYLSSVHTQLTLFEAHIVDYYFETYTVSQLNIESGSVQLRTAEDWSWTLHQNTAGFIIPFPFFQCTRILNNGGELWNGLHTTSQSLYARKMFFFYC